jgi:hypothetical protein
MKTLFALFAFALAVAAAEQPAMIWISTNYVINANRHNETPVLRITPGREVRVLIAPAGQPLSIRERGHPERMSNGPAVLIFTNGGLVAVGRHNGHAPGEVRVIRH